VLTLDKEDAARKAGSSGKPVLHTEVRIVRPDGTDAKVGELGELWVRGRTSRPATGTAPMPTLILHRRLAAHRRRYARRRGGLLLHRRPLEGHVHSGGENVYPAEVESVLHQLAAVAEAAVIGIPDPNGVKSAWRSWR
jgi:Acyl-CoA synthetases (AMP-forming)/AMP-acid ligases II